MTILVVDDEAAARRDLLRVLTEVAPGANVLQAGNAKDALSVCRETDVDVAMLDIHLPGQDGLSLAAQLKELSPLINIVMVTAYPQYALDALNLYVGGYLLKPVTPDKLREALRNLRNPVSEKEKGLYVRCFGSFEVFFDGEIVRFPRTQSKEVFAYLIDRNGAAATTDELCAVLWEDEQIPPEKQRNYFYHIYRDLKDTLTSLGYGDILTGSRGSYAVIPERIACDYYLAMQRDRDALRNFRGEYMGQYSWAEGRVGLIEERAKRPFGM